MNSIREVIVSDLNENGSADYDALRIGCVDFADDYTEEKFRIALHELIMEGEIVFDDASVNYSIGELK